MVDLSDPDTYLAGPPHQYFTDLRRDDPVHWQQSAEGWGYWAVCKHADVELVSREPLLYSSSLGGVVLEDLEQSQLEQMRGMLLAMDPPGHRQLRKPLIPRLTPRAVSSLDNDIRAICQEVFTDAAAKGEVEFVNEVTAHLPTRVIGKMMGLPREDWERIHALAERMTHGQDEDYLGSVGSSGDSAGEASTEMGMYAYQLAVDRLAAEPVDDLTGVLLGALDPVGFAMMFVQLVTAGQDTTQTMLSSGMLALLDHPAQLQSLRDDPSRIPAAVEEILRWANPLHYFRRTATADTELNGKQIKAGDKLALYYTSANRDEDVFDDAQDFDITRTPNRHLSFGQAEHFCVGAHLARLEGRIFFTELLAMFPSIEIVGEPQRLRSNLNNALRALPVQVKAA